LDIFEWDEDWTTTFPKKTKILLKKFFESKIIVILRPEILKECYAP